jgi:ATP-dependent Clp protease ATP-binding subunit ClpB
MTSNLGSEYILENTDTANAKIMAELKSTFRPEFLNRIDEIIIFKALEKDVIYDILEKIVLEIENRLIDKHIKIELTKEAKDHIIDNSYDFNFGARPIKRFVQHNLETLIAKNIILDKIKVNSTLIIDCNDNSLYIKNLD